jgi:hypothetical protein
MQYKHILKNREDAALRLKEVIPMQRLKEENWKIIAVSKGGSNLLLICEADTQTRSIFCLRNRFLPPITMSAR